MKFYRFQNLVALVICILLVVACGRDKVATDRDPLGDFVANSQTVTYDDAVVIKFSAGKASVVNSLASLEVVVETKGAHILVKSSTDRKVNYVLSGAADEGSLTVFSESDFNLILNGVAITNSDGPAISLQSTKNVNIVVIERTNNLLIDAATYKSGNEKQKGTLFSEGPMIFSGGGSLKIYGKYKHGISSNGGISITDGNVVIGSAVSDGVHADDFFRMSGGILTVTSLNKGVQVEKGTIEISNGKVDINSVGDGIATTGKDSTAALVKDISITGGRIHVASTGRKTSALKSIGSIIINSSDSILLTASGEAGKGIKSAADFTLMKGTISISTTSNAYYDADDTKIAAPSAINVDGNMRVENGVVSINSSGVGGKGISVEGAITWNDGSANIVTSGLTFQRDSASAEAKGIKADGPIIVNGGKLTIAAADDGIKSTASITINGGEVVIDKSNEGIEAPLITFNNGFVHVTSTDDCVNGTATNKDVEDGSLITFAGGTIALSSSTGDTFDSNGSAVMTGGTVVLQGPDAGKDLGLDYNGRFDVSGGLLIASGPNAGSRIKSASRSSSQPSVFMVAKGSIAPGNTINILDASGNSLAMYAPLRSSFYLIFSSPALRKGDTYNVLAGGTVAGGKTTNGLSVGGTYTGGTKIGYFEVKRTVTSCMLAMD